MATVEWKVIIYQPVAELFNCRVTSNMQDKYLQETMKTVRYYHFAWLRVPTNTK